MGTVGVNNFDKPGYGGHHYFFWILALDSEKDLAPGLTMWLLLERIEPHVMAMNRLVGTYKRADSYLMLRASLIRS